VFFIAEYYDPEDQIGLGIWERSIAAGGKLMASELLHDDEEDLPKRK